MFEWMKQSGFKPIEQVKVSTLIVEQIKSNILSGDLGPGDPLPSERELMKIFNVSRTSLREALKILDATGFVTISQRKRTRVKSLVPEDIVDPIRKLLKGDMKTVLEVIEVRKCMESWNAYYASERATEEEIHQLGKNVSSMASKTKNRERSIGDDAAFHLAISMMTHNKIQSQLIFSIDEMIRESVGIGYESNEISDIVDEHQHIYQAILKRDPELARQRMHDHINNVQTRVRTICTQRMDAPNG